MSYLYNSQAIFEELDKYQNRKGAKRMGDYEIIKHLGCSAAHVYTQFKFVFEKRLKKNKEELDKNNGWFKCAISEILEQLPVSHQLVLRCIDKLVASNLLQADRSKGSANYYRLTPLNEWNFPEKEKVKFQRTKKTASPYSGGSSPYSGGSSPYSGGSSPYSGGCFRGNIIETVGQNDQNFGSTDLTELTKNTTTPQIEICGDVEQYANLNITKKNNIPNNHPNNTPEYKPKVNTAQNIVKNLSAPPPAPAARKGRRTTVPGQISVRKYTVQEEQFAQKFYENVCVRFPKYMKDKPWERVRHSWCTVFHKVCKKYGGFELVSSAIWWAITEYKNDIFKRNARSLAQLEAPWGGYKNRIDAIIHHYYKGYLNSKKATNKFMQKTAYYKLLIDGIEEQQAFIWANEIANAMQYFQEMIQYTYEDLENKNKKSINHDWLYSNKFLYMVHDITELYCENNLQNKLENLLIDFGNELYDEIKCGNITWLSKDNFSIQNVRGFVECQ